MNPRLSQDVLFGVFVIAMGLLGLGLGWHLPVGTASQMGPGYLPKAVGVGCISIGGLIALLALRRESEMAGTIAWRGLLLVIGAIVFFGLAVETLGMFLTIVVTVGIAALADDIKRPLSALIFAVVLATFCVGLFQILLGVPLPIWPTLS